MATTPLLSIGMIFKNEERCLERCMQSLQPLRDAIPCELIMADTGAEDKSREIAERYADEVFDFPWINDFSAARNAVMDRCTGKWYLTVDCDEWLDADISELVSFLKGRKKVNQAFVIQRNYSSAELEKSDDFSDFSALRLLRMSTGERYHGSIHETWFNQPPVERLARTILHHDGYFYADPEEAKKKAQRNMALLREKLKTEPENLRTLVQCIESGSGDADYIQYIRRAVEAVHNRRPGWETFGASAVRYAVDAARAREMPELDEWIELAETLYPGSIFTRVDVNHTVFLMALIAEDWKKAIRYGENYRKGLRARRAANPSPRVAEDLSVSSVKAGSPSMERIALVALANAYFQDGQYRRALSLLTLLEGEKLESPQVRNVTVVLCQLHAQTELDVLPVLTEFYGQISRKEPDEAKQAARLAMFDTIAAAAFLPAYRENEEKQDGYHRPAYTAFAVLADKCEAGRGAKIMMTDDPDEMRAELAKVENWQALPIQALEHALRAGVAFPLKEKPLNIEVFDGLAARLTYGDNFAGQTTLALSNDQEFSDLSSLYWTQSLVLAALRSFNWKLEKDEMPEEISKTGLQMIRRFAQVETVLLPLLYTPQMLTEENAPLLPPLHRWGLYCMLALDALDSGDPQVYLSILRKGIRACPGEKEIVQFLLDRFMEDVRPKASPELLALAEKVRMILSAYDPNDPAVAAIRESPAYQQVAWFIETESAGQPVQ